MFGDFKITFEAQISDPSPLVVTINRWRNRVPRSENEELQADSVFSTHGNYLIQGVSFEIPPVFLIDCVLTADQADIVAAMWRLRENRRIAKTYWRFVADDETRRFYEEATASTKTRSHVAGTSVIEKNKGCLYFPRWVVDMERSPTFGEDTKSGDLFAVFAFKDTGVKI